MRKLVILTFVSLDGVMQAPGANDEDLADGFKFGGWSAPLFDQVMGETMAKQMGEPFDLLLGHKTYDLFASYWPNHPGQGAGLNRATKYVVTAKNNVDASWSETVIVKGSEDEIVNAIKKLKDQNGPTLQVHGSSQLVRFLLANNLADELWLKIFPVTLGKGKRLFDENTQPANYKLVQSVTTPAGVIIANYQRDGDVKVGSMV